MKLIIRNSNINDLDKIYELHKLCFSPIDQWYKNNFNNYINNSIIIENNNNNQILGFLIHGTFFPCNKNNNLYNDNLNDVFLPNNEIGTLFLNNNIHYNEHFGILMLCIHPNYRKKGLASKLINKHFDFSINNNHKIICLNTRKSNVSAINLYNKMGYVTIAYISNKYFYPSENSVFMIKTT